MPRNDLIQVRSDTSSNWTSVNPTLATGEIGFETNTGKFKIGTGSTAWSSLPYTSDTAGSADTAGSWTTARTITLAGDLTGSASIDGSANVSLNATIAANSVALGTDTTGNYMSAISGTSPVAVTHTPAEGSSATVALASGYGDTLNPYASKTANYVLASPSDSAGVPTFRALVATDVPTLNQNTSGSAATVTTNANLNGPITSVGNTTTITNAAVTGIKMYKKVSDFSGSAYTVTTSDYILNHRGSVDTVVTLPNVATYEGRSLQFRNTISSVISSATNNVVPLTSADTPRQVLGINLILSGTDGAWCELVSNGTYWLIVSSSEA